MLLEFGQQFDRVLDLALHDGAVRRWRWQMLQRPLCEGGDLVQDLLQSVGWRLCFAEQLRRTQQAFAHCPTGSAPGLVERAGLPCGPGLFDEGGGHALAMVAVAARHRHQVTHGQRRGEFAFAHQLLHRFGQGLHQRQAARHPVPAAVEAACQILDRISQPAFHLLQQPALFERAGRFTHDERTLQHQGVGFTHGPHHRLDRVAAQLLESGDALVAVDDQIAAALFDHDDWCLLTGFSQRGNQPPLARGMAEAEIFQAAVQLMKLQLGHRVRLGFQYARGRIGSFPALREVFRKVFADQRDAL